MFLLVNKQVKSKMLYPNTDILFLCALIEYQWKSFYFHLSLFTSQTKFEFLKKIATYYAVFSGLLYCIIIFYCYFIYF